MTKEVLVSIKGLQQMFGDEQDEVEVICGGTYYFKNNKHYIIYEELMEETSEIARNTAIISDKWFELKKAGAVSTHMIFEEKKNNITYYETPVGNIVVGTNTGKVDVLESEDEIDVRIKYALDINYEFVAECSVEFKISAKKGCE